MIWVTVYLLVATLVYLHNISRIKQKSRVCHPSQYFWNIFIAALWLPSLLGAVFSLLNQR